MTDKTYIFRNHAVEYFLQDKTCVLSGYGEISTEAIHDSGRILFLYFIPYRMDESGILTEIKDYYKRLRRVVDASKHKNVYVLALVNYFYESITFNSDAIEQAIHEFNTGVLALGNTVHLIRTDDFITSVGRKDFFDEKYYYTYDAIVNPRHAKKFGDWLEEEIRLRERTKKKCLILDLDNTLWGGILSEDGINKLDIGEGYPGSAFRDFQQLILELKQRGVILCLASKNDEVDVREFFQRRDMPLKFEDFTITAISWEEKEETIHRIVQRLGIGMDSVVFIDDSAVERERVSRALPGVTVPGFPEQPYALCSFYSNIFRTYFGAAQLTDEDKCKTAQYENKISADSLQEQSINEEDFIESLKMKLTYCPANDENIERISQLINKANQFNLTTQRHTLAELKQLSEYSLVRGLSVEDKFGKLGIVASSVVVINGKEATIEEFLLSCRIFGRQIETEYLKCILNELFGQGVRIVHARYIKTQKNNRVETFYKDFGFELLKYDAKTETTYYAITMRDILEMNPGYIWT